MSKIKIYIIATVSSLFIGVSVGLMVSESETISGWAVVMGIGAALGGMMIELTVPETLITIWRRSSVVYKVLAIFGTIASPSLLIWALPGQGISRFSVAFIVASLITYISFYAMERIRADENTEQRQQEKENSLRLQSEIEAEKLRLENELQIELEKMRVREERKTQKALAKLQGGPVLQDTPENILQVIQDEPGISKRQLGDRFNRAPETVMKRIEHLVDSGIVTANGDGVRLK